MGKTATVTAPYDVTAMPMEILNAVGAGLSLIDNDMRIVWTNRILSSWFGKLKDIKGKRCYEVYQRSGRICPNCPSYRSFRSGRMESEETEGINVKGERRDYLLTTMPIFAGHKKPKYVLELTQDITEKKVLERLLVGSENKLKNIFEHINAAIFVISPGYRFTYLNSRTHKFFNIPKKLPVKCCDIFSPGRKWMGCERCQIKECFKTKKTLYYEFSFQDKTYSSMLTPIVDAKGNVTELIEVSLDISDFKNLQERVKEAEELITLGKITGGIAHEIRNPLFGISSIIQLIAKKEFGSDEKKALVGAALFETERLNNLLEDLLILSSPKKSKLENKNPHFLINDILSNKRFAIEKKKLLIRKNLHMASARFRLDTIQIKILFQNLIENAIEASRKKGKIEIKTRYLEGYRPYMFVFRIRNSGDWIRKDDTKNVFEPFFSTKSQGTGLGLSICKRIVNDIKGKLQFKSNPRFTEFVLSLPITAKTSYSSNNSI